MHAEAPRLRGVVLPLRWNPGRWDPPATNTTDLGPRRGSWRIVVAGLGPRQHGWMDQRTEYPNGWWQRCEDLWYRSTPHLERLRKMDGCPGGAQLHLCGSERAIGGEYVPCRCRFCPPPGVQRVLPWRAVLGATPVSAVVAGPCERPHKSLCRYQALYCDALWMCGPYTVGSEN